MVQTSTYYSFRNSVLKQLSGIGVKPTAYADGYLTPLATFSSIEEVRVPFPIGGRLVSAGTYPTKSHGFVNMPVNELYPTTPQWVGINLYKNHAVFREKVQRNVPPTEDEQPGRILHTNWNGYDNGIDFVAEINHLPTAQAVATGKKRFVSVGFGYDIEQRDGRACFTNIETKEVSFDDSPRDVKARIKPLLR